MQGVRVLVTRTHNTTSIQTRLVVLTRRTFWLLFLKVTNIGGPQAPGIPGALMGPPIIPEGYCFFATFFTRK